jgi:hypothetical protein
MIHKQIDQNLSEAEQALAADLMTDFSAAYGDRAALRRRLLSAYGDEPGWWSSTGGKHMLSFKQWSEKLISKQPLAGIVIFGVTLGALVVGVLLLGTSGAMFGSKATDLSTEVTHLTGGFESGALDVSEFPDYVISTGSDAASGLIFPEYVDLAASDNMSDPCSAYGESGEIFLIGQAWDQLALCFSVPMPPSEVEVTPEFYPRDGSETDLYEGIKFTVTLTSPGGQQFSQEQMVQYAGPNGQIPHSLEDAIILDAPSAQIVYFPAASEYGEWQVEARYTDTDIVFASGTITVAAQQPIYSITSMSDTSNPFQSPEYGFYWASMGETLVFQGQGWQPSQAINLVLYKADPERSDDINTVMVPVFAVQMITGADGSFYLPFEIDANTPTGNYRVVFDPQPGIFEPGELGFSVVQP